MNTLKKFIYYTALFIIMPVLDNASEINQIQIVNQNNESQFTSDKLQKDYVELPENSNSNALNLEYELGIAIGTPAIANLVSAIHFGIHGIKLSGFAFPNGNYGLQLDYVYKFAEMVNQYHSINAGFGTYYWKSVCRIPRIEEIITIDKRTYAGIAYNLNLYGFYLQAGINMNLSISENIQPMGQIGYVYQFGK